MTVSTVIAAKREGAGIDHPGAFCFYGGGQTKVVKMAYRNRCKSHDITLIAFGRDNGKTVIVDIVETSREFAPAFVRRWYRDFEIVEMAAMKPGTSASRWDEKRRLIFRTGREIQSDIGKYATGYRF